MRMEGILRCRKQSFQVLQVSWSYNCTSMHCQWWSYLHFTWSCQGSWNQVWVLNNLDKLFRRENWKRAYQMVLPKTLFAETFISQKNVALVYLTYVFTFFYWSVAIALIVLIVTDIIQLGNFQSRTRKYMCCEINYKNVWLRSTSPFLCLFSFRT